MIPYDPEIITQISAIPVTQLFIAGIFAVVMTEVVKTVIGVTDSSIGIHKSRNGQIISAWKATLIYSFIILISNIASFTVYTLSKQYVTQYINFPYAVDIGFIFISICLVWVYMKAYHYAR